MSKIKKVIVGTNNQGKYEEICVPKWSTDFWKGMFQIHLEKMKNRNFWGHDLGKGM